MFKERFENVHIKLLKVISECSWTIQSVPFFKKNVDILQKMIYFGYIRERLNFINLQTWECYF